MPDAFQVLGGCTIGNRGLLIEDRGKMAATITRRAPKEATRVEGVRVVLDPAKTASYPRLHSWYMKAEKVPHQEAISDLLRAEDEVYTVETVEVEVAKKPEKRIAICKGCGESFVLRGDEVLCRGCAETGLEDRTGRLKDRAE